MASWANITGSFAAMYEWTKEEQTDFDSLVTAVWVVGAGIGSIFSASFMKFGKLRMILVLNMILILSLLVCMMNNILLICVGRFFWGVAIGSFSVVCGKYTFEFCPMEYLGPFGGLSQLGISFGICIMAVMALGIPQPPLDKDTWVV